MGILNLSEPPKTEWRLRVGPRVLATVLFLLLIALPGVGMLAAAPQPAVKAIGAAFLFVGLGLSVFICWQQAGVLLTIRPDGVERRGRFGVKVIRWDQLHSYVHFVQPYQTHAHGGGLIGVLIVAAIAAAANKSGKSGIETLTLFGADGTKIKIGQGFTDSVELIQHLAHRCGDQLKPLAMRDFDAGHPVPFGKRLWIKKGEGISWKGVFGGVKSLPFHELESISTQGVQVVIRKRNKTFAWLKLPLGSVPNVYILEQLVLAYSSAPAAGALPVEQQIRR